MIDEEATLEEYGYTSDTLSHASNRRVVAICDGCGIRRDLRFEDYGELCRRCAQQNRSDETLKRMSKCKTGENHPMYGKPKSEETKKRMSASHQGIAYDEWESYARDSPYCPAFNEKCKESNREKYNRECFICGLSESENIESTDKQKKLSVHHIDMRKDQGCDGTDWKLVPVCIHCHRSLHTELWKSRIVYLLNDAIEC